MSKICPRCCESKPVEDFYRCKKNKDGLQSYCKSCIKTANTSWAKDNKGKFREYSKKFSQTEGRKSYLQTYNKSNRELLAHKRALYRQANADKLRESNGLYRELNKEKVRESKRKYAEANREKVLENSRRYREKNKPKYAQHRSARRSKEKLATPSWLTPEHYKQMELIWGLRELKSFVTGVEHEVDHIVPLNSKVVCGLHVPWNLRVIPRADNRKKQNRHWPDMWENSNDHL